MSSSGSLLPRCCCVVTTTMRIFHQEIYDKRADYYEKRYYTHTHTHRHTYNQYAHAWSTTNESIGLHTSSVEIDWLVDSVYISLCRRTDVELIRRIGCHEKDYWIFCDGSRGFVPNVIIKERAGVTWGRGKKTTRTSLGFQEERWKRKRFI